MTPRPPFSSNRNCEGSGDGVGRGVAVGARCTGVFVAPDDVEQQAAATAPSPMHARTQIRERHRSFHTLAARSPTGFIK
jgi:hypothetical protein